jgi:DHA1 family tetracycline resistance protein-like MFS transporter
MMVGICAALVQGGLTRKIVPRLGEPKAILVGVCASTAAFIGYGLAPQGWMIYPLIIVGSLGGITIPAVQSLISQCVTSSEQGAVQGSLTSLQSVASVVGPLIATRLFEHFLKTTPGAAFFFSALMCVLAALLSRRFFARGAKAGSRLA